MKIPEPKNGFFYEALLVGGTKTHQADLIKAWGAKHRIRVKSHIEQGGKPPDTFPDVDFVVVLTKFCGHGLSKPVCDKAKSKEVPIIRTSPNVKQWKATFCTRGLRVVKTPLTMWVSSLHAARKKKEEAEVAQQMEETKKRVERDRLRRQQEAELDNEDKPLDDLAKDPEGFYRALRLVIRMHQVEGFTSILITEGKVELERGTPQI